MSERDLPSQPPFTFVGVPLTTTDGRPFRVEVEEGPALADCMQPITFYLLVARGGTEPHQLGPFPTAFERDAQARGWDDDQLVSQGDVPFKLDVFGDGTVEFSSFLEEELETETTHEEAD
jgi:hypothetical protein